MYLSIHKCAVLEMVAPIYKYLFVLTYSHLSFNAGLPLSFSFREKHHLVCYWLNIMIIGAVCRTKNRPAIQLCYPAVSCSRQVVSSFLPGRLGQVHQSKGCDCKIFLEITYLGTDKASILEKTNNEQQEVL